MPPSDNILFMLYLMGTALYLLLIQYPLPSLHLSPSLAILSSLITLVYLVVSLSPRCLTRCGWPREMQERREKYQDSMEKQLTAHAFL